jgi:hypothetical protein
MSWWCLISRFSPHYYCYYRYFAGKIVLPSHGVDGHNTVVRVPDSKELTLVDTTLLFHRAIHSYIGAYCSADCFSRAAKETGLSRTALLWESQGPEPSLAVHVDRPLRPAPPS